MMKSRLIHCLFGLTLVAFIPVAPARAQVPETYLSGTGNDGADCSRLTPCRFFSTAFGKTAANGQITLLDASDYGVMLITRAVTVAGDASGASTQCCGSFGFAAGSGLSGHIIIAAGPNDVVTLRGLGLNGQGAADSSFGVWINDAGQVNIENCVIRNLTNTGIYVAPVAQLGFSTSLPTTMIINIEDTIVKGNAGGLRITSVPGVTVNATISRSSFKSNSGGGIRIDGTSGGTVSASISDTESSMNTGNGIIAVTGPGGIAAAHITRSVVAANAAYGVQSNQANGGVAHMTVNSSTITTNVSGAVGFFGGAQLLTFGDNRIVGPSGTGFSGPIAVQ